MTVFAGGPCEDAYYFSGSLEYLYAIYSTSITTDISHTKGLMAKNENSIKGIDSSYIIPLFLYRETISSAWGNVFNRGMLYHTSVETPLDGYEFYSDSTYDDTNPVGYILSNECKDASFVTALYWYYNTEKDYSMFLTGYDYYTLGIRVPNGYEYKETIGYTIKNENNDPENQCREMSLSYCLGNCISCAADAACIEEFEMQYGCYLVCANSKSCTSACDPKLDEKCCVGISGWSGYGCD